MPAYKDKAKGTWYASFYYEDWTGKKVKKMKRDFPTKKEALAWERTFLQQQTADLTMTFENFVEIYITDMKKPYQGKHLGTKSISSTNENGAVLRQAEDGSATFKPRDVIAWQNEMLNYRDKNGKAYSPVYLKNAAWTVERRVQPCGTVLQSEIKSRCPGGQYGVRKGTGNALLDKGGVPQVRGSDDGQAAVLLRF